MASWISVKFEEKDVEILRRVVTARGEDLSSFVRRAVKAELAHLGYLSPAEVKALGLEREALPA